MIPSLPIYIIYLAAIAAAVVISTYAIQKIIFITRHRKLYDVPDDIRKIHGAEIPSLGGIGIFTGYIIVAAFFWPRQHFFMPYVLCSSVILFFTGIYDDIMNMRPYKKLVAQLLASLITIYFVPDARIESLYGLFGITLLPAWTSIILGVLCCTFFINVFNFIDGIDGLAGTLATLYLGILGVMFAGTAHYSIAGISFALMGATIGLLFYNITPAKIYMGDTGSMFLGFTVFIFSMLFMNWSNGPERIRIAGYIHGPQQTLILVIAMLYLPVFDGIRVFILRASRGISPLKADRTHLHYYLLDAGFNHTQSVVAIVSTNILMILLTYFLQDANPLLTILCITVLAAIVLFLVYRIRQKKISNQ